MFERRQTIDCSQGRKGVGDDGDEDESALQFQAKVVDYGHGGGGSSSSSSKREPEAKTRSSSLWGQRKGGESENMFSSREDYGQRGRPDESKFDYHPLLRESKTT